jgi:hypothetical protein
LRFATTTHANRSGRLTYRSTLTVGDTSACLGDPFPCNGGLSDPLGAEVHSAIFNGDLGRQAAQFLAPPVHVDAGATAGTNLVPSVTSLR